MAMTAQTLHPPYPFVSYQANAYNFRVSFYFFRADWKFDQKGLGALVFTTTLQTRSLVA